jgi:hypothetical protein
MLRPQGEAAEGLRGLAVATAQLLAVGRELRPGCLKVVAQAESERLSHLLAGRRTDGSEPDAAKAETYFERALAVARGQQAKSWELRAAMSMARLWRDQGKGQQAHDLLAPVYGWFTEGFDTLDLKEAKALLDEFES